jgi:hypothetical protein
MHAKVLENDCHPFLSLYRLSEVGLAESMSGQADEKEQERH